MIIVHVMGVGETCLSWKTGPRGVVSSTSKTAMLPVWWVGTFVCYGFDWKKSYRNFPWFIFSPFKLLVWGNTPFSVPDPCNCTVSNNMVIWTIDHHFPSAKSSLTSAPPVLRPTSRFWGLRASSWPRCNRATSLWSTHSVCSRLEGTTWIVIWVGKFLKIPWDFAHWQMKKPQHSAHPNWSLFVKAMVASLDLSSFAAIGELHLVSTFLLRSEGSEVIEKGRFLRGKQHTGNPNAARSVQCSLERSQRNCEGLCWNCTEERPQPFKLFDPNAWNLTPAKQPAAQPVNKIHIVKPPIRFFCFSQQQLLIEFCKPCPKVHWFNTI